MNRCQGHFLLDEQIIHYDDEHLHLAGFRSVPIAPLDRVLLDCLVRGESEESVLGAQLHSLGVEGDPAEHLAQLREIARQPGSRLRYASALDVIEPDIIVCDFSPFRYAVDSKALVESLRSTHRVLHVGLDDHVTGSDREAVSLARRKDFFEGSLFRFVQWVRSLARFYNDAVLVLAGPQDAVLFGDLGTVVRTATVLEPDWPGALSVDALRLNPAHCIDPAPWLREMYYALRLNPAHDAHVLSRTCNSAFAALEIYGLSNSSQIFMTRADQGETLEAFGVSVHQASPLGCVKRTTTTKPRFEDALLIVADHEGEMDRLEPLFQELVPLLREEVVSRVGILSHGAWHELTVHDDTLGVGPYVADAVQCGDFGVALIVPGMMRFLSPMFTALTSGIPVRFAPADDAGPLRDHIASELWQTDLSSAGLRAMVAELTDESAPARRSGLEAAKRLSERFDPSVVLKSMVTPGAADEACLEVA